jgi:hypothetical protein
LKRLLVRRKDPDVGRVRLDESSDVAPIERRGRASARGLDGRAQARLVVPRRWQGATLPVGWSGERECRGGRGKEKASDPHRAPPD